MKEDIHLPSTREQAILKAVAGGATSMRAVAEATPEVPDGTLYTTMGRMRRKGWLTGKGKKREPMGMTDDGRRMWAMVQAAWVAGQENK